MLFAKRQLNKIHVRQGTDEGTLNSAFSYCHSAREDSPPRTRSFCLPMVTSYQGPALALQQAQFTMLPEWVQRVKSALSFVLG